MRKIASKFLGSFAMVAFAIALAAGGTASFGGLHQAVEPKELKKFKK